MNTRSHFRPGALLTALMLVLTPALAQQNETAAAAGAAALAPASKTFSQQELDQLAAPIALYPDALLAQIFMASTIRWKSFRRRAGSSPTRKLPARHLRMP